MLKKLLKITLICAGAAAIGHRLLERFARNHQVTIVGGVDGPTAIYYSKGSGCPVTGAFHRMCDRLRGRTGQ